MDRSPIERLMETNPGVEVWWDSSPLIYEKWMDRMLSAADPIKKEKLEEQLTRLFNKNDPAQSVIRECTTNPPLSLQAIKATKNIGTNGLMS